MMQIFRFASIAAIAAILLSCGGPSQVQCPVCLGSGKVQQSQEVPIRFEIVSAEWKDAGVFNPDYYLNVVVKNLSDKGGNFKVIAHFIYEGIGARDKSTEDFIAEHSTKRITVHYDADKRADKVDYEVIAPYIVETKEEICPNCDGQGVIKK